jgi:hypothetical protein
VIVSFIGQVGGEKRSTRRKSPADFNNLKLVISCHFFSLTTVSAQQNYRCKILKFLICNTDKKKYVNLNFKEPF